MSGTDEDAGIAEPADGLQRHLLGSQSDDRPAAGGAAYEGDLLLVDRPQLLGVVDALLLDVQERPLDVHAKDAWHALRNRRAHCLERRLDLVSIVADQCR